MPPTRARTAGARAKPARRGRVPGVRDGPTGQATGAAADAARARYAQAASCIGAIDSATRGTARAGPRGGNGAHSIDLCRDTGYT